MKIVHFQRRPGATYHFSIERLFETVRANLPRHVDCKLVVSRHVSTGLWHRLHNMIAAAFLQGDVNHVTGDIHYVTCLLRRKRTVLTILDCGPMASLRGWRRWLFQVFWLQLPARRAALITTISGFSKSEILKYVRCHPDKVRVVGVPVGCEFQPHPKQFNATRPAILQIGTQPNKNLERVAEALRGLSCELRIVGTLSEPQRAALESCGIEYTNSASLTNAELVGEFRNCDMVVFASTYEGFGMPIVEANAIGRPVIAGNVCSMPEVAGDAALLVDPFDVRSIREGILTIVRDHRWREELVGNGFVNARRFTPDTIAAEYHRIYTEVWQSAIGFASVVSPREAS